MPQIRFAQPEIRQLNVLNVCICIDSIQTLPDFIPAIQRADGAALKKLQIINIGRDGDRRNLAVKAPLSGTLIAVRRQTVKVLFVSSLILSLLVAGLWGRSYFRGDRYGRCNYNTNIGWELSSEWGAIELSYSRYAPSWIVEWNPGYFSFQSRRRTPSSGEESFAGFGFESISESSSRWGDNRHLMVRIPYYAFLIATSLPAFVVYRKVFRHRYGPGRCARCGYDLRATPNRCPECGTTA